MSTQRANTLLPTACRATQRRTATQGTSVPTSRPHGQPGRLDQLQREYLVAAAGELALALLGEQPTHDVLQLIATRARQGTAAALALVGSSTGEDLLFVEAVAGADSDWLCGRRILLTPMPVEGLALDLGETADGAGRILVLLGLPAAGRAAAVRAVRAFAEQAAAAFKLTDQRASVERARLLQDRDRTAIGLLELVIPRLFTTGLLLAGADGLIHGQPEQARVRVSQAVDDLDLAIAQVRTAALGLRTAPAQGGGAAGAVQAPAFCSSWPPPHSADSVAPTVPGGTPGTTRQARRLPEATWRQDERPRRRAGNRVVTANRQALLSARELGQDRDRSQPRSRSGRALTGVQVDPSQPIQAAHGIGASDPAPERLGRQFVADLLQTLQGVDRQIVASLDAVLLLARIACPSCLAVSLTVDHETQPVTITTTRGTGRRRAPSMTVRLPRPSTNGPARQPAVLEVFATDPVALASLADDIAVLMEIDPGRITLAAAAAVPQPTTAGLVLAGQLADRAAVDQALGALLEQGWDPPEARRELQRRAADAGVSLTQAATIVLAALPGVPPQRAS